MKKYIRPEVKVVEVRQTRMIAVSNQDQVSLNVYDDEEEQTYDQW
jgi:hypothetical protein